MLAPPACNPPIQPRPAAPSTHSCCSFCHKQSQPQSKLKLNLKASWQPQGHHNRTVLSDSITRDSDKIDLRLCSTQIILTNPCPLTPLSSHTPVLIHPVPNTPLSSHIPVLTHPCPHTPVLSHCHHTPLSSYRYRYTHVFTHIYTLNLYFYR